MRISNWTVDYGNGPTPVEIPHAWRQDVPVAWEGPAFYRTILEKVEPGDYLLFEGVSYEAIVRASGVEIGRHRGIWDAFAFAVPPGDKVAIEVEVRKNGGPSFPVRDVASGFLPFVYHTFGGIYEPVSLVHGEPTLSQAPAPPQVSAKGARLVAQPRQATATIQDQALAWLSSRRGEPAQTPIATDKGVQPLYLRGVLTWGWYPSLGHCNPPDDVIQRELDIAKDLGFNLIKFCLWVPSHRFLELLDQAGMWAWIELPLWDPTADTDLQESMATEVDRIVEQYAHHPNIALWTCGCELHESTSAGFRQRLYDSTRSRTLNALVKDNSGSAEMYGGDLREYGDFYDFHPYCDLPFYPEVLDSLAVGPRPAQPILLGEFNDIDAHRDLARVAAEAPYWMSQDPALNDVGVRWQHDLPSVLPTNRFAQDPGEHRHEALMASSLSKARFIRKLVQEAVRSRGDIAGYVVTGWRDTPISSAGMLDDWGEPRFSREDLSAWNRSKCLFVIPTRRPPWVNGGNRPGWIDPFNHFAGRVFWRIGLHSEAPYDGNLEWDILHVNWDNGQRPRGRVAHGLAEPKHVAACQPAEVAQIAWEAEYPGGYLLRVRFGDAENAWPFWVVPAMSDEDREGWLFDPANEALDGLRSTAGVRLTTHLGDRGPKGTLVFLSEGGTIPMPFWRESSYEFSGSPLWEASGYREKWERLLPMTPDRAIDMAALSKAYPECEWTTLMNRVDVRTYLEHPVLVRGESGQGSIFATTLRPFGGLGNCPRGLRRNPSGMEFLRHLRSSL